MTIHLPESLEISLLAEVRSGHFASLDDAMAEAVRLLLRQRTGGEDDPEEEAYWFKYDATLRIFGHIPDFDGITRILGLSPTHTHRRGDRRSSRSQPFGHDMWSYQSPVPEDRPLDAHIETLWAHIRPHRDFLMRLKERLTVDVFCGYRSNCGNAGIEVSHRSLEMFIRLEIPFGLSIGA